MPETMKECAHEGCHCQVAEDQTYCSEACAQDEAAGTTECHCDHGGCGK